jgi:hypothetical protein
VAVAAVALFPDSVRLTFTNRVVVVKTCLFPDCTRFCGAEDTVELVAVAVAVTCLFSPDSTRFRGASEGRGLARLSSDSTARVCGASEVGVVVGMFPSSTCCGASEVVTAEVVMGLSWDSTCVRGALEVVAALLPERFGGALEAATAVHFACASSICSFHFRIRSEKDKTKQDGKHRRSEKKSYRRDSN